MEGSVFTVRQPRPVAVRVILLFVLGLIVLEPVALAIRWHSEVRSPRAAPEFTHDAPADWLNSEPLRLADLRGRVVLIDFWAFECWNCYRSFPWLNALESSFAGRGLAVIGVHAPEFERERRHASVLAKAREFGLDHPIMIDNDFSYWRAMDNRYWPTWYLIDKRGRIRYRFVGETHADSPQAARIHRAVETLLAE